MIYDRNGLPLTENLGDHLSLSINKHRLINSNRLIKDLSEITGHNKKYFINKLSCDHSYITLVRKLTQEQVNKVRDMGWNLIEAPDIRRVYPYKRIGGQIIGITDVDNRGVSGIEMAYDTLLRGESGWRVVDVDVLGNPKILQKLPFKPAINGGDVVLTIDIAIQSILQEELAYAMKKYKPVNASGLIIDPHTGEIFSISTLNDYDPNTPNRERVANQRNRVFCDLLEIGSILKVVPVAILLERGYAQPASIVDTNPGYIQIYGHRIHDVKNYGILTLKDAVSKSSNVAIIKFCKIIQPDKLYRYIIEFGLLNKTGIELSGERKGSMPEVEEWSGLTKPNIEIGQGIAITALSMSLFYQAIANKGLMLKPRLTYGIRRPDSHFEVSHSQPGRRVISEQTAITLTDFLVDAVENGTGKNARIKGIQIAGKTSTANKPDLINGGYHDDKYVSSFIGFFPVENPMYLIMILIDEPKGEHYFGGAVAAPLFRKVAERIIKLKPEIRYRSKGTVNPITTRIQVPDYCYHFKKDICSLIEKDGFTGEFHGKGQVVYDQTPPPGVLVERGSKIRLTLGPDEQHNMGIIVVPMLIDHSLRDAIRKATNAGLVVKATGSGRIVRQSLPVGSLAETGDVCKLVAKG